MADHYKEEIKAALQNNGPAAGVQKALEYLDKSENIPLNVAITGESGSGKSTLVRALTGIKPTTAGKTTEPTEYIHPENSKLRIWDLPGIGTKQFPADRYLELVEFEKYDFFIIVSSDRFRENDAKLAKEIQKTKKEFYFLRSKIDRNVEDEKNNRNFSEESLLNLIRNNCIRELQKLGSESPKIFLVSGLRPDLYELEDLWETLKKELPELQREALLSALTNTGLEVIEQKKKVLRSKIKWYTLMSAAAAFLPALGLIVGVDLGFIFTFVLQCQSSLGLTLESLQSLSSVSGVPLDELRAELKSPLASCRTRNLMIGMLTSSAAVVTVMGVKQGVRLVPFGIPVIITLSSAVMYGALRYTLYAVADDAQRVFKKAVLLNSKWRKPELY